MNANIDYAKLYIKWLNENIEQYKVSNNISRITLPFMDKNNDFIDIYIINQKDNTYTLTDDGAILNDLIISGFDIKSKRRNEILKSIIRSYGISISNNNELTVNCSIEDLPIKKHLLAQCMIKVNDMFFYQKTQCNLYKNIFEEGELIKNSVVAKIATTATDGKT